MSDIDRLRAAFTSGATKPAAWRTKQLQALARLLEEHQSDIVAAIQADMSRPTYEAWLSEVGATRLDVKHTLKNFEKWMRPERVGVPSILRPSRGQLMREPLGVVLIIGPWNYPIYLLLTPLAAALAAGNCVVLKPSEVASSSSAMLARLIPQYLDSDAVLVVEGGVPETTALLEERFDHILYTGNPSVGRIVAEAAAKHLTPITLELGGKSPVIVHHDANVKDAARRVAFGKFSNAGQTCVAADHVWVHSDVEDEFAEALESEVARRYGRDPRTSADFGRIINTRHAERIAGLLESGGFEQYQFGGQVDVSDRYIAPTALRGVARDARVMSEEIFGPVLPILRYTDLSEPITSIREGDKPLALYVFTGDVKVADRVLASTSSGGACVNDVMMQVLASDLPFGGVGASGHGSYHGRWGFETFSHRKSVVRRPRWMRELPVLRAPYRGWKLSMVKRLFT